MISDAKYSSTKSNGVLGSSTQSAVQQAKLMSSQVANGPPSMNGGPMIQTAVIGTGAGSKMMSGQYQPIKSIMNYNHASPHHHYHNSSNYMLPAPLNSQMHYHHHNHHGMSHHIPHSHHHAMSMINGN